MPCCVNNNAKLHPMTLYWAGDMKAKLFAPALYEAEGQSHKPSPPPLQIKAAMTYDMYLYKYYCTGLGHKSIALIVS
jgi:hypothetical protein